MRSKQLAQESLIVGGIFTGPGQKANKQNCHPVPFVSLAGETVMKNLSILVPAAMAGVLVAATVFAAPMSVTAKPTPASAPDRAEAYRIATAD